jgi:putative lysine transport system permease protein
MGVTLLISLVGTIFGFGLGILLALLRKTDNNPNDNLFIKILKKIGSAFAYAYIEVFRGTPMMVQALVIFYGVAYLFGTVMSTLIAGFVIVSLNTAAYMAEIIRSGLNSIDVGQIEGGRSLGLTYSQTMFKIVLPQAIKNVIPAIGNELVVNIKDTSVLSVIMVTDLFYNGKLIVAKWYAQFPVYFIVSCIYLMMTIIFTRLLRLVEKKLNVKTKITNPTSITTPQAFATNDSIDAENYGKKEERRL